ncbi:hemagglutinin repeat-containing protein [Stenotrophomonas sp. AB1(2024)]|uniref:hemagglutinin repeat-containing protein n=1 Tax=Stenotrophomonas sp. AB1(2024) TaxID=3132215 RepID=UPI0030B2C188
MNNVYRLVFNRALMVWQVASELTNGAGRAAGGRDNVTRSAGLSTLAFALMCSFGWVSAISSVQAQQGRIVGDPNAPGNERPTVLTAPNGAPLVNITTPSAAGVSRNRYSQFDVGPEGAILNNARSQAQTQLGGWVQGNPYLATGTARVILNEVNGPASQLNGYVEVAGRRAEVIIANPAGIQVNGGGFLNASRVTLTTGTPMFSGGALEGYRVSGGAIDVTGAGLDTSQVDYTDLITRSLRVNAGIWANQLQASLGSNQVTADGGARSPLPATGEAPAFALDVGALGGMFANKIFLVGNEHGVGVRNAGTLGAQAGELVVTVDGRLENTGALQSRQDVRIDASGGVVNAGTIAATRELTLNTPGAVDNSSGTLNAQRLQVDAATLRNHGGSIEQTGVQALSITADTLSNRNEGRIGALDAATSGGGGAGGGDTGTSPSPGTGPSTPEPGGNPSEGAAPADPQPPADPLAAGALNIAGAIDNDGGTVVNGGTVSLQLGNGLDNQGGRIGVQALDLAGDLRNDAGTLQVHGNATLQLGALSNQKGSFSVAGVLQLDAQSLDNRSGQFLHGGTGTASWTIRDVLQNDKGVFSTNADRLILNAGSVSNAEGRIEHAGSGGMLLSNGAWTGAAGSLNTAGALEWSGSTLDLRGAALTASRFQILADSIDSRGGSLLSLGTAGSVIRATQLDNSSGGTIAANGDLTLTAEALGNAQGLIQQAGDGTLRVHAATLSGAKGQLLSAGALALSGGQLNVSSGVVSAQQISIDADALNNAGGRIVGSGDMALNARNLDNRAGAIEHAGDGLLQIHADALQGAGGRILSLAELQLQGGNLALGAGSTTQAERIRVTADALSTAGGTLNATGTDVLDLRVSGALDNHGGSIATNGAIALQAGSVDNRKGSLSAAGSENSTLDVVGTLDSAEGTIASNGDTLDIHAARLDNSAGTLSHAGSGGLKIDVDRLDGSKGTLVSKGALTLRANTFDHREGTLGADRVDLKTSHLDNSDGTIVASGTAASRIQADQLDNAGGTVASNGDLLLQATTLDNTAGTVQHAGAGQLQINAQTLLGQRGTVLSNGALALTGQSIDLRGASTSARGVVIDTGSLTTASGTLSSFGDQALQLTVRDSLDNSAGNIASNGELALRANSFINNGGQLQAAGTGHSTLAIGGALDNQQGKILLGGTGNVDAASLDNRGGTLHAAGLIVGIDGRLDNRDGGLVSSAAALELDTDTLDNAGGTLYAGTVLRLTTATALNNDGGAIQASDALTLRSAGLSNAQGKLIGGSVDIDTRGLALGNQGGTIGSQTGALDIRSGALDNSGGRLQSQTGLRINSNGQAILNTASDSTGGILAGDTLRIDGGALDNRGGTVLAQGEAQLALGTVDNRGGSLSSAARLTLDAASLANVDGRVQAGTNMDVTLAGLLDNQRGAIAAGQALTLKAASVDNRDTRTEEGTLGLQAGQLELEAQSLDNRQGQVVTDGDTRLQLAGSLDNSGGAVSSGGSLDTSAASVNNEAGLLRATGNQTLVARNLSGNGQIHAQRDLSMTLQQGLSNDGELIANGTLALDINGDLANQGIVRAGNLDLNAANITNAASGEITSQGVTHLAASGQITNRGLIDGSVTHLEADTLLNVGTGRIYGDHVALAANMFNNRAETIDGTSRAATVAARERLDIGVRMLANVEEGLIYSDGDAAIGGALGTNRLAIGTADTISNIGSIIDVAGDLSIDSLEVNNIRENVVVEQVTTVEAPVRLDRPSWWSNGKNNGSDIRTTGHYSAHEVYYLNPADIIEDEPYITPDGFAIHRAVVRLTAQTTAYLFGRGGLYAAYGERSRLNVQDGTVTLYYVGRQDNQVNPDKATSGADDPFAELSQMEAGAPAFRYVDDTLTYSDTYGTCTTDCVQLWTYKDYNNPDATLTNPRGNGGDTVGSNEQYRIATRTVTEDVLAPGIGADAVIRSGGAMRIRTDALVNSYGGIAAGGNLDIAGNTTAISTTNRSITLYRTHEFDNVGHTFSGDTVAWSNPAISEIIGTVSGSIITNGTLTIDGADLSNLNEGRDAPNVQNGAAVANLNLHGPDALQGSPGSDAQGPQQQAGTEAGQAQGQGVQTATGAQRGNGGGAGPHVVQAAGDSPDRIAMVSPDIRIPTASLFNVRPNSGNYLIETDPRFADHRTWLSSDYLLTQMGFSPDGIMKRLGDGYYEQKLIREQIGELTGRRFLEGYASDEEQYQALLGAGATFGKAWGLRPGVALTEAQMAQLTSDIVWLVEQTITLADGSTTTALVPQVYVRLRPGDLDGQGALLAGADVDIKLSNGLVNSGNIAGRALVSITAGNIEHLGGDISGQYVGLSSNKDILISGATVTATDALSVQAAGNVTVASTVETLRGAGTYAYETTQLERVAGLYVTNPSGQGVLSVAAGGDIRLQAAQIRNAGEDGITQLTAGGTLDLGAQTLGSSTDATFDDRNHQRTSQTTHAVTSVQGAGDVVLAAGKDINLAGTQVKASDALVLQAGGDINSQAQVDSSSQDLSRAGKRWSEQASQSDDTVRGSQLSAGSDLLMVAGRDINLAATGVRSDDGTVLVSAGRDVNLLSVQENHEASLDSYQKKKGTLSSTTTTRQESSRDSYAVGTVLEGAAIDISAGRDLTAVGAVVDATGNVSLGAGNNVLITSAEDQHSASASYSSKKSGFSGGLSNGVASVGYNKSSANSQESVQSTTQVGSAIASREGNVLISAGNQLTLAASDVVAGENLTLVGKDIQLLARQDTVDTQGSQSSTSSGFSMGVTYDPTKAYRSARDSTTDGMADSGSIMGDITRNAEGTASGVRAATTSTVVTGGSQRSNGTQSHSTSDARVTQLAAGGDMTLIANGGSITSQGAQLSAEGDALLLATKDIVFDVAHNTESSTSQSSGKGWGFANNTSGLPFGTNNSRSEGAGQSDTITGTQLSVGGGVRMATTEGDITLTAANVVAEKDVNIRAAGNLTVRSGQDTVSNANTADSKAIGTVQISDTEKFAGWHREQHEDDSGMVSQVASTIGSLGGNVNLGAGGKYTQIASNVVAAQDVNITAAEIELLTANETGYNSQSDKDLKIGVFARVKSPFIDLINNVDAARESDGRLAAMQGMAAGANAYQAGSAIAAAAGGAGSGTLFSAEAGIGFKSSSSSAEGSSTVSRGSTIQGGGNVNLTSTSGDIHIVQGNLSAGNTLALDSARDILLEAGQAHLQDKSKSNNAGAEVGVGVSVGAQTGVYVYAEASVGSGKSKSDSSTWQNTELTGKNISLKAEGDTTLRGATATADRIDVKTGGTLTIESLQDVAESMSKDSQVGGRVQVSVGTAWDASGYASASKANGSYKGVGQQSGLFAGDGGYHVDAGHVNLVGGAIASTNATNSELTAETFAFTDLKNEMDYKATSAGISGGAGGAMVDGKPSMQGATGGVGAGVPVMESGGDTSTTYATLTEGNITIGGKKVTAAELGVNSDASKAHQAIDVLPDLQKLMQDTQAMGAAAGTVIATGQQIASDIAAAKSNAAANAYLESLGSDDARAEFLAKSPEAQREVLKRRDDYNEAQKWATGGSYSRALEAVTTALVGAVAGQGNAQVASNALAPYAANFIGSQFDPNHGSDPNATMQLISHALLGALLAEANGGSAGSGAAAAAGGELAAKFITDYLYGGDSSQLGEQEKQNILALSQAVGALAGASGGDGLSGAGLGAILAKNAVENNFLTPGQANAFAEKLKECAGDSACQQSVQEEARQLSQKQDMDLRSTCAISPSSKACNSYVAAATEYRYSLLGESLGIEGDQRRSGEELGNFAHSADGSLYRGLIFENGGLEPVYILPQEYTLAGLAQWTGSVQESVNDNGWWSTETGQILAFGLLKVAARKLSGVLNISGENGGFGKGSESKPSSKRPITPGTGVYATNKEAAQAAEALGYRRINETVHGNQLVFKRGNQYITRDLDGHNGGAWKMAKSVKGLESKATRQGTFDKNMQRIGD